MVEDAGVTSAASRPGPSALEHQPLLQQISDTTNDPTAADVERDPEAPQTSKEHLDISPFENMGAFMKLVAMTLSFFTNGIFTSGTGVR